MPPPEADADDRITASGSDLVGIFHVLALGKGVYSQLAGAFALIFLAAGCVVASARVLGNLVEALVNPAAAAAPTERLALIFLSFECLAVIAQYYGRLTLAHATIEVIYRVRCQLFAKMQRLPIAYFDTQPLGRTITRLTADVDGIETFFSGTLARVLIAVINIASVLIAMLVSDWRFGGMMVAASLPAMLFTVALRRPVVAWLRAYKRRSAHLNAKLAEYLNGVPVIKIFGLESWTGASFSRAANNLLDAGLSAMNWNSFIRPMTILLCSAPTLLILWLGGERVIGGTMALGLLVVFVRLSERFVSPIRTISQEIQNIQEAVVSSERVRRMLLEKEESDVLGPDGVLMPALKGEVEYRGVAMRYGSGQEVLKSLSFHIRPGMKVGLVGATGSGKTSTINLLPRLYPFFKGEILLDGIPIEKIKRAHLRSQLGYVSQDVVVFAGTLRDNLLNGTAGLSDGEILAACGKTGLSHVIANFPGGLDYLIAEGGENLSMGERQLIAFTRMLIRSPAILLLDEATASIDERCERLIQKAITGVMSGRTCFVVAHRLSTIRQCDLILVFNRGQIAEAGTHDDLLRQDQLYARLVRDQGLNP